MSRIGLSNIVVPNNVTVLVEDGGDFGYKLISVTGPKGVLKQSIRTGVKISLLDGVISFERDNDSKQNKSFHGLYRSLINNMVIGVTNGFSKTMEIVGIGYRAEMQGSNVVFSVGYSHKIVLTPPEGISITVEDQTKLKIEGADKQKVGEIAAKIRSFKKPEPYKGKGIKYTTEIIKKKSAKSV